MSGLRVLSIQVPIKKVTLGDKGGSIGCEPILSVLPTMQKELGS